MKNIIGSIQPLKGGSLERTLEPYRGKPVLLLFFNIGCLTCKSRAIPYARDLQRVFPGLELVGIHTHIEGPAYSSRQIEEVLALHKVAFPVYMDEGHAAFDRFRAEGTPHWGVFDPEGQLVRSVFGSFPNSLQRVYYALTELTQEAESSGQADE